jgi:hypothetical protein
MKNSQSLRILAFLKSGKSITPIQALNRFGCFRLAARIHNLKAMGYRITSTTKTNPKTKKKYASYSIY